MQPNCRGIILALCTAVQDLDHLNPDYFRSVAAPASDTFTALCADLQLYQQRVRPRVAAPNPRYYAGLASPAARENQKNRTVFHAPGGLCLKSPGHGVITRRAAEQRSALSPKASLRALGNDRNLFRAAERRLS